MIDVSHIRKAAERIDPFIERTPLRESFYLSEKTGLDVFLKLENCQPTGSFKVRGALNFIASLPEVERLKGVVAWSAGNHALGVAYAAKIFDTPATIFIPEKTPASKVEKLKYYPVEIRMAATYEDCEREGRAFAAKEGAIAVHPYDDWAIVAGQGTVGLEIYEKMPEVDAVVVPVGGGGLISGIALAMKSVDPDIQIIAVQSASSPSLQKSLQDGVCYEEYPVGHSIAEGVAGGIGKIVYALAPQYIDEILHVDEENLPETMVDLLLHEQIVAEASGAIPVVALHQIERVPRGSRVVAIISGGNVNWNLIRGRI